MRVKQDKKSKGKHHTLWIDNISKISSMIEKLRNAMNNKYIYEITILPHVFHKESQVFHFRHWQQPCRRKHQANPPGMSMGIPFLNGKL